jgi:hypothetical protein
MPVSTIADMLASDDISVLSRAIDCAQRALSMQPNYEVRRIGGLLDDVQQAYARPCEAERVIDDHTLLFAKAVQLADASLHRHDRDRAQRYGRVITALLPDIQNDLLRALEIRNLTRPTP